MSFLKKMKRSTERLEKKKVRKHIAAMYEIMGDIKEIAQDIHDSGKEWNEDNIVELASEFTDRTIGDMEKFMLLGNLSMLEQDGDKTEPDNS